MGLLAADGGIGSAQAAPSGTPVGVDIVALTSAGNSNNDNVGLTISYLDTLFGVNSITYLGMLGGPGNNALAAPPNETITGTTSGQVTSGTFSALPYPVVAYDVKAGNDNALYNTGLSGIFSGTADTSAITAALAAALLHPQAVVAALPAAPLFQSQLAWSCWGPAWQGLAWSAAGRSNACSSQ